VNLFIPSSVRWKEQGAVLTQTTAFPENPATLFQWKLAKPTEMTLKLRHPRWSRSATVLVNGAQVAHSTAPSSYVEITRLWHDGDRIELRLAMEVAAEWAPGAPDIVAFTYGPLVLAGAMGKEGLAPGADIVVNERQYGNYNNTPFTPPTLAGEPDDIIKRIRAGEKPLEFIGQSRENEPVWMIPYYRIAHQRYATYWPLET
jgi:DUF1680 family protein